MPRLRIKAIAAKQNLLNSKDFSLLTGVQKTYAELLVQAFGQCQFLHYGLRSNISEDEDYPEQQRLFADKIFDLGNHSCDKEDDTGSDRQLSVLLFGFSFAYLAKKFKKEGHRVKWVDQELNAASNQEIYTVSLVARGVEDQYSGEKDD